MATTTSSYTPGGSFSWTINGRPLSAFTVSAQDNFQATTTTTTSTDGTATSSTAAYYGLSSSGWGGALASGINPPNDFPAAYLLEDFGITGTPDFQKYGGFSNATPSGPGSTGTAETQGNFGASGVSSAPVPSLTMGSHTVEIAPYCQACVCQLTTTTGGQRRGIPGVAVTITVRRAGASPTGGGSAPETEGGGAPETASAPVQYTVLGAELTRTDWRFGIPYPPGMGGLETFGNVVRYPNSAGWSPEPNPSVASDSRGCPTPARMYDPFFGRDPAAAKDIIGIYFTLTFPSGKVWTGSVATANVRPSPFSPQELSLGGDSLPGISVYLVPAGGAIQEKYTNGSINSPASPADTDWGAAAWQAAAADGSDVGYDGSPSNGGTFTELTDQTSLGTDPNTGGPTTVNVPRTVLFYGLQMQTFLFDLDPSYSVTLSPPSAPGGDGFDQDAHGRPAFLTAGPSGVQLLTTADGGHTFPAHAVAAAAATDASLWYDRRTNSPVAMYGDGAGAVYVNAATASGEAGDWGGPQAVAGVSGEYPVWAPHPTALGRIVAAYLDGSGSLKTAVSYQGGGAATWSALGTVDAGLDFSATGRAGLCWLGDALVCAYGSGDALLCKASADGGATWGAAVTVASAGPYTAISLRALQKAGALFLTGSTAGGSTDTALLWTSGDLGGTWQIASGTPPAPASTGTALGVLQGSGRLLAGTASHSDDAGASWLAD